MKLTMSSNRTHWPRWTIYQVEVEDGEDPAVLVVKDEPPADRLSPVFPLYKKCISSWTGSAAGELGANQWPKLLQAIDGLATGPQTFTITWSIALADLEFVAVEGSLPALTTVELKNHDPVTPGGDGLPIGTESFRDGISTAMGMWKKAFEQAFSPDNGFDNQLTFNPDYLGYETGTSQPGGGGPFGWYSLPHADNIGNIRFMMGALPLNEDGAVRSATTLLRPFAPDQPESDLGDIIFNSEVPWRLDGVASSNDADNILFVATHEIGHSLGLGHDDDGEALMAAGADSLHREDLSLLEHLPEGIAGSALDMRSIEEIYNPDPEYLYIGDSIVLQEQAGEDVVHVKGIGFAIAGASFVENACWEFTGKKAERLTRPLYDLAVHSRPDGPPWPAITEFASCEDCYDNLGSDPDPDPDPSPDPDPDPDPPDINAFPPPRERTLVAVASLDDMATHPDVHPGAAGVLYRVSIVAVLYRSWRDELSGKRRIRAHLISCARNRGTVLEGDEVIIIDQATLAELPDQFSY